VVHPDSQGVGSGGAVGAYWPCFQRGLVDFVEEIEISKRVFLGGLQFLPQVTPCVNV